MSDHVSTDNVEQEIIQALRIALAAAGRMGENLARMREERARRAQAQSEQNARQLAAQYEAERAAARAQLQPVWQDSWWERADVETIGRTYETAAAWREDDDVARDAEQQMKEQLQARYGIDVDELGADPQKVAEKVREREEQLQAADVDERDAAADAIATASLLNAADKIDRAVEEAREVGADERAEDLGETASDERDAADEAWDTADRREAHASKLREAGVEPDAIAAQQLADVSNAKHPREAVRQGVRNVKARKARTGPQATRQRGERSL